MNIQYTSGTTGSPKGVLLTHHNLVNNGALFAGGLKYTEEDRVCVPVPLYHCFGCVIGVIACVTAGAAILLPAAGFDAGRHAGHDCGRRRDLDLRRAHDVHRRARASRVFAVRFDGRFAPA